MKLQILFLNLWKLEKKENEVFDIDNQVVSLRNEFKILMDKRVKLQEEIDNGRELAKRK